MTLEIGGTAIIQTSGTTLPATHHHFSEVLDLSVTVVLCDPVFSSELHEKGTALPASSMGIHTAQPNDINDIMPNGLNFDVYNIWLDESLNRVFTEQQSHVHVWVFWNFRVLISIF